MKDKEFDSLRGTQDRLDQDYGALRALQESLQGLFSSYGYRTIDTPVLESAELYLLKSGAEVASRMYTFVDPGGRRVALRPEFTASVIRAYTQTQADDKILVRWQYCGPVFRYGPLEETPFRQFTQLGAELIGSSRPRADAEIVSLANKGIGQIPLTEHQLVVGHVGVALRLLQGLELSERAKAFLANSMEEVKQGTEGVDRVRERSKVLGLERTAVEGRLLDLVAEGMDEGEARAVLAGLMKGLEDETVGNRDREEIVARFLRKVNRPDDPAQMEKGIKLVSRLSEIRGEPEKVLAECRDLMNDLALSHEAQSALGELESAHGALNDTGLTGNDYHFDLGLVRDLAYYTGLVFEIRHPSLPEGSPLCGGGRYDGLVKALGGSEDTPALGFAYSLENVLLAETSEGKVPLKEETGSTEVLVVPGDPWAYSGALSEADRLRDQGKSVEVEVREVSLEHSFSYAEASGIAEVAVVSKNGEVEIRKVGQTSDVETSPPE